LQQATIDAIVTDIVPGLRNVLRALGGFVDETIGMVNNISGRLGALEQAMEAGDGDDSDDDDDGWSVLMPDDAKKLHDYIVASVGLIAQKVSSTDPARQTIESLAKKCLEIIKESVVEEEDDGGSAT
jgi:hypothetical protein